MLCFDLSQRPKNNASFRFFAVGKRQVSKSVPGREKTGIYLWKPRVRNRSCQMYFLRWEKGIYCSGTNLDSGLFRGVQFSSSMLAKDREKTGMTLLKVVYYEKKDTLIRVCFMCFFLTEILRFGCAKGAPSSGRSPGRSVVPYGKFSINKNKKFGMLFTL